jgi:hypothetical protein
MELPTKATEMSGCMLGGEMRNAMKTTTRPPAAGYAHVGILLERIDRNGILSETGVREREQSLQPLHQNVMVNRQIDATMVSRFIA